MATCLALGAALRRRCSFRPRAQHVALAGPDGLKERMGMVYRWHLATAALALCVAGGVAAAPAAPARPPAGAAPPAAPAPPAGPIERTLVNPDSVAVFPFERAPADKNAPAALGEAI